MHDERERADALNRAWNDAMEADVKPTRRRRLRLLAGRSPRTRSVIVATGVLALGISSVGVAQSGALRGEVRNGTYDRETEIIANEAAGSGSKGGYGTRQSNLSNDGGGAIYGCRSTAGGTPANKLPCIRANNLSSGLAFEFNAQTGLIGGTIAVGNGGDSRRPFTTNATGVATGLNADRVDGLDATQIAAGAQAAAAQDATNKANAAKTRWALVNSAGAIEAQSGGFSITACYPAAPAAANGNCYINAGEDLSNNGITSTIALQNGVNQGGNTMNGTDAAADQNLEFSGEIANAKCNTPGSVTCAPAGTNNDNHLVVSPRLSDGQRTADGTRKRFYVTVTPNG